jgi:dienelactone hydrolase
VRKRELIDEDLWKAILLWLPPERRHVRGGPPRISNRAALAGILFVLRHGLRWRDLPPELGEWNSVWRRFARWSARGVWERLLAALADDPAAAAGPKVCVGYCMGARLALRAAAARPDVVAAAGIHPGALVTDQADSPHHDLAAVRGELYFAFAENDRSATEAVVERFRRELDEQGVEGVVERLPGTSHGFAMADLPVYDRTAAERHFERTLGLWRRSLGRERGGA